MPWFPDFVGAIELVRTLNPSLTTGKLVKQLAGPRAKVLISSVEAADKTAEAAAGAGAFWVVDRLKELIKYKGYQVAPAELEALLLTHPDVLDVAVVGIAHVDCGEAPEAFSHVRLEERSPASTRCAARDRDNQQQEEQRPMGSAEHEQPFDQLGVEVLMARMRPVQFYLLRMDMIMLSENPLETLRPHLHEHTLWLAQLEDAGLLFLSGPNRDETGWDGSATTILSASSHDAAMAIGETDPLHRAGIRKNTVHGWSLTDPVALVDTVRGA
jgi:uncharacterized protein YciI